VMVGTCVVGTVVGRVVWIRVVAEVGTVITPGRGVPDGDCRRDRLSPAPAGLDEGVLITCAKYGSRRTIAAQRTRIKVISRTRTGIPEPVAGPAARAPVTTAGTGSGSGAPQAVQNFWTGSSVFAPHFGQNLRVMIV